MRINLRVEFTNSEVKEIVCSARDLVAFEDKFNRSVAKLESEFKLTDLLFLAWHSEHRRKETKKDFDAWLDDVEQIGVSENDPK
jgi:hypothetical protein